MRGPKRSGDIRTSSPGLDSNNKKSGYPLRISIFLLIRARDVAQGPGTLVCVDRNEVETFELRVQDWTRIIKKVDIPLGYPFFY